ncbi:MAG: hypothetical protein R3344_08485 [Acidobacteriota bacterium]|nr:hypothetical protein [Acidobacteriota bacterium]
MALQHGEARQKSGHRRLQPRRDARGARCLPLHLAPRPRQALDALESKLVDGRIVVESPNRRLANLAFCRKGEPSRLATRRYGEILDNIGAG